MAAKQETFEAVYTRLEETVQQLESGGLPLDDSITLFERGMQLARQCKELLDGAELRVTTLVEEYEATGLPADGKL
jgi:exodeoxyribonuclease VII small subunit